MIKKWWALFSQKIFGLDSMEKIMFHSYSGERSGDMMKIQRARFEAAQQPDQITVLNAIDSAYFDDIYTTFFRLDSISIYLMLRAVALEGEEAVFKSKDAKEQLIDHVIDHYIRYEKTEDAQRLVDQLKSVISEDLDPEDLFYFLGPSLTAMALQQPDNPLSSEKAVDSLYKHFMHEDTRDPKLYSRYQNFFDEPEKYPETAKLIRMRLSFYLSGFLPKLRPGEGGMLMIEKTGEVAYSTFENAALEVLEEFAPERTTFSEKISPMELSVEVSKQIGGLAVRLMQLVGIFFKLSPENRKIIAQVFDKAEGQTKLQFYNHLKKLADEDAEFKKLFEGIEKIGDMLGGGSIVTVFSVKNEDGKWAVGTNNPNVVFRAGELKKFADKILDGLISRDPHNRYFRSIKTLMNKAYQWLLDEIDDPESQEKSDAFSENIANYVEAEGTLHGLKVPSVIKIGSKSVRWEEEIKGSTLNDLLVEYQEAKDEKEGNTKEAERLSPIVKSAVATVGQNYISQLDSLLAHSDIHPGQFIVMDDERKMAVLDRKNLLKLDDVDGEQVKRILKGVLENWDGKGLKEEDHGELVGLISQFFRKSKETEVDAEAFKDLRQEVFDNIEELGVEGAVSDIMWSLLQEDFDVPIPVILVIKNLLALHRMSEEAGFNNIGEMLLYEPSNPDIRSDAAHVLRTARRIAPNLSKELIKDEMIAQLKGKKVREILKDNSIIETVKKKTRGLLDRVKEMRNGRVPKETKERVDEWFRTLEEKTSISLAEKAEQFGVTPDELKELLGYAVAAVEGNPDVVVKSASPVSPDSKAEDVTKAKKKTGGIDLNADFLKLEIQHKEEEIEFLIDEKMLKDIDIKGLLPIIINVTPIENYPVIFGRSAPSPEENIQPQLSTNYLKI